MHMLLYIFLHMHLLMLQIRLQLHEELSGDTATNSSDPAYSRGLKQVQVPGPVPADSSCTKSSAKLADASRLDNSVSSQKKTEA